MENTTEYRNITDMRSGRLLAVERTTEKRNGNYLWRCKCDCGREILIEAFKIANGTIKSCGCLRGLHYIDLAGQRFGMLTAMEKVPDANAKEAVWHCRCDCGNECDVRRSQLERGCVQDCGCISKKRLEESNLTGKCFGNLTVIERLTEKSYRCRCDCGNEKTSSVLLSCPAEVHPAAV